IDILPEISGRVTGIHFKEGSFVKEGQLLVQLYDQEIRAMLQKLKAQRRLQQNTEERQKSLLEIGGISKQDYETTQTQVQSIDVDIALAEAQLRATKIIAPFSGNIGIRNISEGAVVTPSTLIATLQQTNMLKMDFTVPDRYSKNVHPGKEVMFSVAGVRDTLTGKITAVDPGADQVTRTIRVRATVSNPGNKLVAGSFARVLVPLESDSDAILIPSQSVIPTTKDKLVAVVRNGKVDMATVQLGARTADKVEVLNGLQPGDTILITGLMQAKKGMDVKITEVGE
ncbi:MAG: efflux RND transporter periplasmic adaptor subunit, partial [Taibaiella sp.]|nr:efflux RND transporter periplasmic adaptor subunit [Taibaiella sp.]